MNTLISYDWLKQYVKLKETPDEFARRISLSGPAVEKIVPQGEALDKIVVGHVMEVKAHPNADKLRIARVDVGLKNTLEIVCGGSNLVSGQLVAVALIGAKVRWHGEGDLIELKPAEIRGVKSDGMICGASEIGLADAFPHGEREILDLKLALQDGARLKPGTLLADALGLASDVVMDVEVTSNRVDAMGMVGMAREAAAILNRPFIWEPAKNIKGGKDKFSINVRAKQLCPRYMAVKIDGVKIGPSPWWLKRRLMSAGLNSINNVVDITNFVLLELAQPMHAFDAATIEKGIEVRLARPGEKIRALDKKDYQLDDTMLVIADAFKPIAIAGVMGGEETGVTVNTTSIILEAASFDPVSVRRTARKLNLQSDSQLRFEKGLSVEAPPDALARAVELVLELAGGKVLSSVVDVRSTKYKAGQYTITSDEVNSLIGVALPLKEMVEVLRRLGFKVSTQGKQIKATVPWWRDHDIEMARDLVEEIARVYGYGNIPAVVPVGLAPRPMEAELVWEDRLKEIAKGAGMIETFSYSFVSAELLDKAGYDSKGMLHVQNPLTADLEIMRTTLLPSLLQVACENRDREPMQRLFEVSKVYYPQTGLPNEELEMGALFMGMDEAWKVAKGFVEHVLFEFGIPVVSWKRLSTDSFWHPGRTVQAFVQGELVATVGEVSPKISNRFKLENRVALVDMPLKNAVKFATMTKRYVPLSPFPPAKRDLAVVVDARTEYDDVAREIENVIDSTINTKVEWFDTYKGKNLPTGKKSIAMHLEFSSQDRTLESKEVDGLMEKVQLGLKEKFEADVRA